MSSHPSVTYKVVAPHGLWCSSRIIISYSLTALALQRCLRDPSPVDPRRHRPVPRSVRPASRSQRASNTVVSVYLLVYVSQHLIVD